MIKFKAIDYCYKPANLLSKSITDLDRAVTGKRSLNAKKKSNIITRVRHKTRTNPLVFEGSNKITESRRGFRKSTT